MGLSICSIDCHRYSLGNNSSITPFHLFLAAAGSNKCGRAFWSYFWTSDGCLYALFRPVTSGYLFELPDTVRTISKVCNEACKCGALVAITASDVSCIERHYEYDDYWEIMENYADIVFANSEEARAKIPFLLQGSYIGVKGEAIYIPVTMPVDTCGAGDAYPSGIFFRILRVSHLKSRGSVAAKVAPVVVGQQGTRHKIRDAIGLAEVIFIPLQGPNFLV
uniref:Carbohydrate kinase PfkB domain-containing protein n=1 Tax=Nicotiana tabacum TaxID=4097 RepID=A0A1S4CDJ8_TOBAC|nr:PREDICTED: uncharacterized protein LOC107817849 [Nicotiana tabacum]